jgi:hypothetical protein
MLKQLLGMHCTMVLQTYLWPWFLAKCFYAVPCPFQSESFGPEEGKSLLIAIVFEGNTTQK